VPLVGQIINVSILALLVAMNWIVPRKLGGLGLVAVHLAAIPAWFAMAYVSLATGIWEEYDGFLVIVGLVLQAFIFNCLMLPVSITAVWRWYRFSPMSRREPRPH
jgi:hypothetical protein